MPTLQYPKNPNVETAFVIQDDGTKNRVLMVAPQDISTLELPNNANSTKGYVTIDGKKQRVILTAVVSGGGDNSNLGYFATLEALQEAHPTAEPGNWAIVGTTDTVWVWDSDTSAWVDTDQKGQVTSVNNKTGDVTITADDILPDQTGNSGKILTTDGFVAGWVLPEIVQRSTMPMATEDESGKVYQYVGATDANYTNGYFYKCVSDGGNPATYSWVRLDVQPTPSGLPDQTGQSGKFLTTDGTDASWSDKPLVNTATGTNSLTLLGTATAQTRGINIGASSSVTGNDGVAIGAGATANIAGVAIGRTASAAADATALGWAAKATANYAIQLGYSQTNSDANTLKVANQNGNFEMMSADGTIPEARLADTTSATAGQALRLDSNGNAVWENITTTPATAPTLLAANWSSNQQTVNVTGVTASNTVIVSPAPASAVEYAACGILCTTQGTNSLTFTCTAVPANALTVNVVILN